MWEGAEKVGGVVTVAVVTVTCCDELCVHTSVGTNSWFKVQYFNFFYFLCYHINAICIFVYLCTVREKKYATQRYHNIGGKSI